ncbi:MAG: hypothetical protein RLZZ214_2429 [Verrucomicrobiota bacterium]|jgi:hypothetical protein
MEETRGGFQVARYRRERSQSDEKGKPRSAEMSPFGRSSAPLWPAAPAVQPHLVELKAMRNESQEEPERPTSQIFRFFVPWSVNEKVRNGAISSHSKFNIQNPKFSVFDLFKN